MPIKMRQIDKNFGVQEIFVMEMHMKAGPVVGAALIFTLHFVVDKLARLTVIWILFKNRETAMLSTLKSLFICIIPSFR